MTKEQREKAIDNGQYTVVSNGALPSTSTCGNSSARALGVIQGWHRHQ